MSVFFDSNIVIYSVDHAELSKQPRAQALVEAHLRNGTLVTSTQVMQETYNTLTRKKGLAHEAAWAIVELLSEQTVIASDAGFVLRSLQLAHSARLSVWDGLIVQAALDAGCTTLLTEDLHAGMRFGALEVVNPFVLAAHAPASPPFAVDAPAAAKPKPAQGKRR